jgi:hypothetical protein
MKNTVITIVLVFSLFLFGTIILINTIVYAQQLSFSSNTPAQSSPSSSPSSPNKLHAVKIISPTKGQQLPVAKNLTISGTSIDNATSNCQVSMSVNHVRPYQPVTAAGTGGANDYSKWNFVLTSKYTTIQPGPTNRITAKYTCIDNPAMVSYSSVNVTGVGTAVAAPTTAYALQQQTPKTNSNNNTITTTSNGDSNKITAQDNKPSLTMGNNNNTTMVNGVSTAPVSTPTNTPGSGKLLYLGINSKSANKADDTNTKAAAHHSSSSDDNFSTTKIKTQHTSSDKSTKTTTTIAEHHSTSPSSSKSKTSYSNGKSNDGGVINSEFGHSDPLSDALDRMSDALDHLFG